MKNLIQSLLLYIKRNKYQLRHNIVYIFYKILNWIIWIAMISALFLSCILQDTHGYLAILFKIPFYYINIYR